MNQIDYAAVRSIYDAMLTEKLGGVPIADIVGGGADPLFIAEHFMALLLSQAGLSETDHVLDIGCGCGRLAGALTQHIKKGSYVGIDIVAGLIGFARTHIASQYGNFRFLTARQSNQSYDYYRPDNSGDIATIDDACSEASIDLCIATSLFTHLSVPEAIQSMTSITRALKPDGRVFATFFLLDGGTRAIMRRSDRPFSFSHELSPGVFVERKKEPSYAVGFEVGVLAALLARAGLYVERILYGNWSGRPHHASFQDILILRKIPTT